MASATDKESTTDPFTGAARAFAESMSVWMAGMSPAAAAWAEEAKRHAERMAAVPRIVEAARRAKKWATPHDVIMTEGPVRLLRFRGEGPVRHATPLLFVFALVNRPYVLDLLPHKSVVRRFLEAGFDVWMIDWGVPEPGDSVKTLHDYINGHMHRMVNRVLDRTGQPQLSILGYCMGGTKSAMYASQHQALVRNLIMLAAPVDWSCGDCLLKVWTDPQVFDVDQVVAAFGNVPPAYLGGSFNLLKPIDNNIRKWMGFYDRMDDDRFVEEFIAMETWVNDNIPISGAVYRDFVRYGMQRNELVRGRFPLGDRYVDLGAITCPVLTLVADSDHLVPAEQSTPLEKVVGSTDTTTLSTKAGHIGLAVGSRAHKELWPQACAWLAHRSQPAESL